MGETSAGSRLLKFFQQPVCIPSRWEGDEATTANLIRRFPDRKVKPLLIRPRFTDFHGVHIAQHELDFAIPFLNEDIPLYVDPYDGTVCQDSFWSKIR